MGSNRNASVLLVHPLTMCRVGLRHVITMDSDMQVCAEAATLEVARDCRDMKLPQVMIVNPEMESGRGYDFIQETCQRYEEMHCIVYSSEMDREGVEHVFKLGALAVLSHEDDERALLHALSAVKQGVRHMSSRDSAAYCKGLVNAAPAQLDEMSLLSERELEIYRLIGQGLMIKEVAARAGMSPRTVESHEAHIKTKLQLPSNGELRRRAIIFVNKVGIVHKGV